jgi:hypothetical protein
MSSDREDFTWRYHWSVEHRRAAIVTAQGYTVCPPRLSEQTAAGIVGEHNRLVRQLEQFRKEGLL